MARARSAALLLGVLLAAPFLSAQEAPYLTVLPRQEQVRQLELRGDLGMIRKRYLEAIDYYTRAVDLDPENPVLLNKLGIAYHQLLRLDDAQEFYERATEAEEDYANAWNNLGAVRYAQEDYGAAIRYYRRALRLDPARAAIRSNLGTAYFAREEYDDAFQQYRLALLLDAEVFEHHSLFGVLMQDTAVKDRARFYFLVAKSFASLGYVEKCVRYLRRALENGFPPEEALNDPGFAAVAADPRFQAVFAQPPATTDR